MRNAFSRALVSAARDNSRIILLTGDHGYSLFDEFRRACPAQYINAGVAEQNMVGVAAGLAKKGYRPVVYGLSAFVPIRVLEQIKIDVCHESLPVIFIGDGAGVVYAQLGASHQSTEDLAALRAVPNIAILSPADEHEMTACLRLAFNADRPVYVRMGKVDLPAIHESPPRLDWGELCQVRAGKRGPAWLATGAMVSTALTVATGWPGSPVWSLPFVKPLRCELLRAACQGQRAVIVLEEHSIHGGLGGAVAESLSESAPAWVCRVGVADRFSERCGSYAYLRREHQLNPEAIARQVRLFLRRVAASEGLSLAAWATAGMKRRIERRPTKG
jgi:transketolase